eukprot:TRINITY_DN54643_c0_g1_i1.p1 TRINITY_DN54643_c0_g1~~TRINITY_DN54643_c0_g1_i1.p1  ORF type:complete len:394 (+),score=93.00 TRINITY_DN54643_c0_g1_i1:59-1240(+)
MLTRLKASLPWAGRQSRYEVGDRVSLAKADVGPSLQVWSKELVGTVVEAPANASDGQYVVEFYAPAVGEESNMNPFLTHYSIDGLRAAQLRAVDPDKDCGFTAVGRKGTSMCSVPLEELHVRGRGGAAQGRSARLGGLSDRPDLEGLTGTVVRGPDARGEYIVNVLVEESGSDSVAVPAENVTLRVRRGALAELSSGAAGAAKVAAPHARGELVPFLAAMSQEAHQEKALGEEEPSSSEEEGLDKNEQRPAEELPARSPSGQASPRPGKMVTFHPATVSPRKRPSKLTSLSPAAAAALAAAGKIGPEFAAEAAALVAAQAAEAEASVRQASRDQKFEALDAELASCMDAPDNLSARLASTPALGGAAATSSGKQRRSRKSKNGASVRSEKPQA